MRDGKTNLEKRGAAHGITLRRPLRFAI